MLFRLFGISCMMWHPVRSLSLLLFILCSISYGYVALTAAKSNVRIFSFPLTSGTFSQDNIYTLYANKQPRKLLLLCYNFHYASVNLQSLSLYLPTTSEF